MLGRVAVAPEGDEAFGGLWPGPFGGQHGRLGRARRHDGVPARLPSGRALLFRRRPRRAGRRRGLRLRPRDLDGGGLPLRPRQEEGDRLAAPRGRRAPHGGGQRAPALGRAAHRVRRADELAGGRARLRQGRRLPARLADGGRPRRRNMVDPLYTVVAKFPKRFLPRPCGGHDGRLAGAGRASRVWAACPWTGAESCPDARSASRSCCPGCRVQGARAPLALRNDANPGGLPLRAGACEARPRGDAADAHLRLLPRLPRVSRVRSSVSTATQRDVVDEIAGRSRGTGRGASTSSTPASRPAPAPDGRGRDLPRGDRHPHAARRVLARAGKTGGGRGAQQTSCRARTRTRSRRPSISSCSRGSCTWTRR